MRTHDVEESLGELAVEGYQSLEEVVIVVDGPCGTFQKLTDESQWGPGEAGGGAQSTIVGRAHCSIERLDDEGLAASRGGDQGLVELVPRKVDPLHGPLDSRSGALSQPQKSIS